MFPLRHRKAKVRVRTTRADARRGPFNGDRNQGGDGSGDDSSGNDRAQITELREMKMWFEDQKEPVQRHCQPCGDDDQPPPMIGAGNGSHGCAGDSNEPTEDEQ